MLEVQTRDIHLENHFFAQSHSVQPEGLAFNRGAFGQFYARDFSRLDCGSHSQPQGDRPQNFPRRTRGT